MSFTPDVYTPNKDVLAAHKIPRFNYVSKAFTADNNFVLSTSFADVSLSANTSAMSSYLIGLVSLPVIIIIVGIVSIIIFQVLLIFRCCCRCLVCGPREDDIATAPEKVIKSRNRVVWSFKIFVFVMVVVNCLLFVGNNGKTGFQTGITNIIKAVGQLSDIVTTMLGATSDMKSNVDALNIDVIGVLQQTSCAQQTAGMLASASSAFSSLSSALSSIVSMLSPLPDQMDSLVTSIKDYNKVYIKYETYALFAFFMLLAIIFYIGYTCASKRILILGMVLGEIWCILITLVAGFLMILVALYADFCMNPATSISSAFASDASLKDITNYYLTCQGTGPFDTNMSDIDTNIGTFETQINSILSTNNCAGSSTTSIQTSLNAGVAAIGTDISILLDQTKCEPVYHVFNTFVNKAICDNTFSGLYWFWISICWASVMLYFVMCFSSVMWSYFGVAWKLQPENVHTGTHLNMVETSAVNAQPHDASHLHIPAAGYKQEYTFTAASPTAPVLTRRDIEMI